MSYLHLGKGAVVDEREIVGIFDLDITSQSHLTRRYLAAAERAGEVAAASEDLPKSFVVCEKGGRRRLLLSPMNTATLLKRSESGGL
ncbi:MAG: DUF370 domain-containing protein [Eubacteriales bacterium]|nr:DUF370 domain-containing protein [Eubacteriales bacterium]